MERNMLDYGSLKGMGKFIWHGWDLDSQGAPMKKIWSGTHSLYDVVTLPEFKSTRGGFDYLTLMNNEHFSHRSLKNKENNSHKREYVKKIMNPPILNPNLPSLVFYLQFLAKNPPPPFPLPSLSLPLYEGCVCHYEVPGGTMLFLC